ncbi:hypothetical protein D3C73_1488470 [compost metagenome]
MALLGFLLIQAVVVLDLGFGVGQAGIAQAVDERLARLTQQAQAFLPFREFPSRQGKLVSSGLQLFFEIHLASCVSRQTLRLIGLPFFHERTFHALRHVAPWP